MGARMRVSPLSVRKSRLGLRFFPSGPSRGHAPAGKSRPGGETMPKFISRRKLAEDADSVLSDLGTSAEEVASSLVKYGVGGGAETSSDLLTLYLNAVMGGDRRVRLVEVTDDEAQIWTANSQAVALALPKPVVEFMFIFDAEQSCFKSGTASETREGKAPPVSGEPDESSEHTVRNDDSTDQ